MENAKSDYITEELKKRFMNYTTISVNDLYEFYKDIYGKINKSTVDYYIFKLKKNKIVRNVSRGQYVLENNEIVFNEYVVITMDVINSSNIDYYKFNNNLENKIHKLNNLIAVTFNYGGRFNRSQGDEMQILWPLDEQISVIFMLALSIFNPFKVRYGISVGKVSGEIKSNTWEMNEPIFWNARDKLNSLKKSKEYDGQIKSEYNHVDRLCNSILLLINKSISRITDKQWEAIKYELSNREISQATEELEISTPSYYARISSSNINEIIQALKTIFNLMKIRRSID